MRHKNSGRQFSRNSSHRRAMLRALTANLIAHERIETTDAKAKELRRVAERVITKARRLGAVAYTPADKLSLADRARRQAAQKQVGKFLQRFAVITVDQDETEKVDLIEKVFVELAKRYQNRAGGYTRIIKVGNRRGDNAPISIIELVEEEGGNTKKSGGAEKKAAAKSESGPKAEAKKSEDEAEDDKSEAKGEGTTKKPKAANKSEEKKAAKGGKTPDEKKAAKSDEKKLDVKKSDE